LRRIFAQGYVIAVSNPKTALFFAAFVPQFVEPSHGSVMVPTRLRAGGDDPIITAERVRWIGWQRKAPGVRLETTVDERLAWEKLPLIERVRSWVRRGETAEAVRLYRTETRVDLAEATRVIAGLD
jgi:hypothetical protein